MKQQRLFLFAFIIAFLLLVSCGSESTRENTYDGYIYNQEISCFDQDGNLVFYDEYVRVIPMGYGGGTWRVLYHDKDDVFEFSMDDCEVDRID